MNDIKIFVSHRIDIDSELIQNPIYVPVRCGAAFDHENKMNILGDDTGDNISEKRMSFCEFTVQYWVWKNTTADYYGLCHYRRYLSFATNQHFRTDEFNMVHLSCLTTGNKRRLGLLEPENMRKIIEEHDIVVSEYADIRTSPTPDGTHPKTLQELWVAHDNLFFEKSSIDLMFVILDEKFPIYSKSAREYFDGQKHRGFNCYVLKHEVFERMCELQFGIMFELEKKLNTTGYTQTMNRTPAFIGEMLYGIFIYHVTTYEQWRVKELQLVFFSDTDRIKGYWDLFFRCHIWNAIDRGLRFVIDPIMPKGSRRREVMKNIFYAITHKKQRGVADIEEQSQQNS